MCLLPTRILAQGAAVAQPKIRSYYYAKSYVLSCSLGRSCPRVYLYADEGTKSRIPISRLPRQSSRRHEHLVPVHRLHRACRQTSSTALQERYRISTSWPSMTIRQSQTSHL